LLRAQGGLATAYASHVITDRIDVGASPHQFVDDVDRAVMCRMVEGGESILRGMNAQFLSCATIPKLGRAHLFATENPMVLATHPVEVIDTRLRVVELTQFGPLLSGCQLDEVRVELTFTPAGLPRMLYCMPHPLRELAIARIAVRAPHFLSRAESAKGYAIASDM